MNASPTRPRHAHAHERDPGKDQGPFPFFAPVNPDNPVPAAHGNVRVRHRCRCGARRDVLVNGHHVERGPWVEPEEQT